MHIGVVLPFEPHMPSASWMTVHGRLEAVETHAKATVLLVDRAGGLQNLKLPGLAGMIAYADLIDASARCRRPSFLCWWQTADQIVRSHNVLRSAAGNTLGRAFFAKVPGGLPGGTLSIMVRLATIDRYMAERRDKEVEKDEETQLITSRNAIQHSLLSLPSFEELTESEKSGGSQLVYEICRLIAVLYSNAVVLGLAS